MTVPELYLDPAQKRALDEGFASAFAGAPTDYYSAPGRTEIGGNHTDHQRGRVLAAAVNLDARAAVAKNGTYEIRVYSRGFGLCSVDLANLQPVAEEINTTAALIRGMAAGLIRRGVAVSGFDAYVESDVPAGSGLSSSAAFEVLVGTVMNGLFGGSLDAGAIATVGQEAENVFFGKPCGLMDQMASSVGGLVGIDFCDPKDPCVHEVSFDFATCGYALCIIDSGADHADLTDEYTAIPQEMKAVAEHFGKAVLSEVPAHRFYGEIPVLRNAYGDRAVLRALHFYEEQERVSGQIAALEKGNMDEFLRLVRQSGQSSYMYLQNVIPAGNVAKQPMALALALCGHLLGERGAYRVHGGGFAGTVQAFVPVSMLAEFRQGIEAVLGEGTCRVLSIRPQGGAKLIERMPR